MFNILKVCGNDGVTYESMCELRKATCTKGIQMSHPGACVDLVKGSSPPYKIKSTRVIWQNNIP